MTTIAEISYALMAGASYISTRNPINQFPVPMGWTKVVNTDSYFNDQSSGFEAIAFTNGSEIVISFAGTDPGDLAGDMVADLALAAGALSIQLKQAAQYYLQVKAVNPDATISFTGHSLGGGQYNGRSVDIAGSYGEEGVGLLDTLPLRGVHSVNGSVHLFRVAKVYSKKGGGINGSNSVPLFS